MKKNNVKVIVQKKCPCCKKYYNKNKDHQGYCSRECYFTDECDSWNRRLGWQK